MINRNSLGVFITILVGTILTLFILGYVQQEHPAYLWDWGNYYYMYQEYGNTYSSDASLWIKNLLRSIYEDDYNASSVVLLTPVYLLAGGSRIAYIIGIFGLFIVPAALISASLSAKASELKITTLSATTVVLICLLTPPLWQPSLRGMTDVVGLIPLGAAAAVILNSDYLEHNKIRNAIIVGLLVWLAFMLRRWYAYAGFSLIACAFVTSIMRTKARNLSWHILVERFSPFLIIGCVGCALVVVFQLGLSKRILASSYPELYQGYQAPIGESFHRLVSRSGYLFVVMTSLGLMLALARRNFAVIFFGVVSALTFVVFTRTQAPSVQHGLPIVFFFLPAFTYPIFLTLEGIKRPIGQIALGLPTVLIATVIFSVSFSPSAQHMFPNFTYIAPKDKYLPLKVENYQEYRKLIEQLSKLTSNGEKFSVFASSEVLADSLLRALDEGLTPNIEWASQVDERDGFRLNTLKSKFAVVATPTPLHLPETSQRVVSVPADQILTGKGIGLDYIKASGPYHLAYGHDAYIFERIREIDRKSVEAFADSLKQHHPNWSWDGADWIGPTR